MGCKRAGGTGAVRRLRLGTYAENANDTVCREKTAAEAKEPPFDGARKFGVSTASTQDLEIARHLIF